MVPWWLVLAACTGCGDREREFQSRADPRYPAPPADPDGPLDVSVARDEDDGVRTAAGFQADGRGDVLRAAGDAAIVLRFDVHAGAAAPELALLHLPVIPEPGAGPLELRIRGLGAGDAPTSAAVTWSVPEPWPDPYARHERRGERAPLVCAPFERTSPDLAPVVAELLASGAPRLGLVIEALSGELQVQDRAEIADPECPGVVASRLTLHPTLRSTLAGREMLARPTDRSVTVSLVPAVDLEVTVDVWSTPEDLRTTPARTLPAGEAAEIVLDGLQPSTAYRWRARYRRPGGEVSEEGPEHTFHTARSRGERFTFTVTSDTHLLNLEHRRAFSSMHLLRTTMTRIGAAEPDFHLDLGDIFNGESYRSYDAPDAEEMARRTLSLRPYYELADAPVIVVPGNHEGEQGWRIAAGDPLPALATRARQAAFPSPVPSDFYRGNAQQEPEVGVPGDYFAFEWGDALIVALDPYRYTPRKPHTIDDTAGTGDRWDWTLGREQYDWLVRTLEESRATFKLVFSHQVTGGTNEYGRGGRQAALFNKQRGSYEWGGRDPGGADVFDRKRPGWGRPVHQVLAEAGVTAFVHGHDHVFAFEPPLDGVGYLTVPQPDDARYDRGHAPRSRIDKGARVIENSGHVAFTVSPRELVVEYVRSYLPGDGPDGRIAFRHTFTDCDGNGVSDLHDVARGRADADGDGRPDDCR